MKHKEHDCQFNYALQTCECYDAGYDKGEQDILKKVVEKIEGMKEEVKYGMDTTYGDTEHPHPSVVYGHNQALDDLLSSLKEPK